MKMRNQQEILFRFPRLEKGLFFVQCRSYGVEKLVAGLAEWQTQGIQNPPPARVSRFKSGVRYSA